MHNFKYYAPTKVVFGRDTQQQVGELVREQGFRKVLLHYGGGSVVRSGLLDQVKRSLEDAGVSYAELGGVVPNPRLDMVYRGIALARQEQAEMILAVGGGSVIDSAKAIGYGVMNDCDVWDLYSHKCRAKACLPIGVVLTIAATGSEMSNSSVITKADEHLKRSYNDDLARPRFAVMNPELTVTVPAYQTFCGCSDILMHTMERYFTNGGHMELTDSIAEALMRTVIANARILKDDPANYDARAEVMWASSLSHNNLTGCGIQAGDFACHALEHDLGGMYDVSHGAGLTSIWGSWARYVVDSCLPRFKRFALNVVGAEPTGSDRDIALRGIEALEAFFREIGMPTNLHELGLQLEDGDLRTLASMCAQATGGSKGSAKVLHEADMYNIYRAANA